jgi:hypothetical protein
MLEEKPAGSQAYSASDSKVGLPTAVSSQSAILPPKSMKRSNRPG